MVGRFEQILRVKRISNVTLRALPTGRVRRVRHIKLTGRCLRSGLETQITTHWVLVHAQPGEVGFVAGRTTARASSVDHGCRRRWRHKSGTRTCGFNCPTRYQSCWNACLVTTFTVGRAWQVRVWTRPTAGRHHYDAGNTIKTAATDARAVAAHTPRTNACVAKRRVAELGSTLNRQLQTAN